MFPPQSYKEKLKGQREREKKLSNLLNFSNPSNYPPPSTQPYVSPTVSFRQPTVIVVTVLAKTFALLSEQVELLIDIGMLRKHPTLYTISLLYTDNQRIGECRVPPNPTFTLHSPYIFSFSRLRRFNVGQM